MTDCLFCKIADKKIPAHVIYEDDHAVAFLDITPRAPGHTLVIPKHHAPDLTGLSDADVGPLFLAVKKVDALLMKKLSPDGLTLGMNQGAASGQEVGHAHVHLVPRWHSDNGGSIQSIVHNTPTESLEEIKKKITA